MMSKLPHYQHLFAKLNPNKNRHKFPATTRHGAPHKPFLLLAIMDLVAGGLVSENRFVPDQDLIDNFLVYWDGIMGPIRPVNIGLPFHHLATQGFWHPVRRSDGGTGAPSSAPQLQRTYEYARLDQDLFMLLLDPVARESLRKVLVETYFVPEIQAKVWKLGTTTADSLQYARILMASENTREYRPENDPPSRPVKDQGFRRAVVRVYSNRCALCGIRMITPDGHTAVDAAHIKDWAISHNDHPTNGFALCKLCHWSFDNGLVTVNDSLRIEVSSVVRQDPNLPGHLASFQDRDIILPRDHDMYPSKENLVWHRKECFVG
ncbi:HNH endonuclease [Desulfoplanes sp. PS50]